MSRLTWIVGPPGAGKSTLAAALNEPVVELTDMLAPLVVRQRLRGGVLTANALLVAAVRAVALNPDNARVGSLVVVAGIVAEEALFPLAAPEEVWLVLPDRERWERQLLARPVGPEEYDDHDYARLWYERFSGWLGRLPVRHVDPSYDPDLVGARAPRTRS